MADEMDHKAIFKGVLQHAREVYQEAKAGGMEHPVIVVCPPDVYAKMQPDLLDIEATALRAEIAITGNPGFCMCVEPHDHIYEGLLIYSPKAAEALGSVPDPLRPFPIVIITAEYATIHSGAGRG